MRGSIRAEVRGRVRGRGRIRGRIRGMAGARASCTQRRSTFGPEPACHFYH